MVFCEILTVVDEHVDLLASLLHSLGEFTHRLHVACVASFVDHSIHQQAAVDFGLDRLSSRLDVANAFDVFFCLIRKV